MHAITHISDQAAHSSSEQQHGHRVSCIDCCMKKLCITAGSDDSALREIDKLVVHWHPMERGRHIFREGDRFTQAFVVRSGAVKTYQTHENGEEQITGFMLPGDVLGLEGLSQSIHSNGAVALETTSVCAIPMNNLFSSLPSARIAERQVFSLLSEAMDRKDTLTKILAMNKAHERIAAFLVDVSERQAHRNLSENQFSLAMSRSDIARYLGLSQESVSRAFAKLIREKVIECEGRSVKLSDSVTLRQIAGYSVGEEFLIAS